MSDHDALATSFGAAADAYENARPSYPADMVAALFRPDAVDIADIGAGTGKLTQLLPAPNRRITAVEPDARMATRLNAQEFTVLGGSAEQLPLADNSMDALVFGQAWHWVDPPAASAEAARVLRAGGTLGLIWNIRDERTPWVATMSDIIHRSVAEQLITEHGGPTVTEPFSPAETRSVDWVRPMTVHALLEMVRSRSDYIAADPVDQQRMITDVTALAETVADETGTVGLPYRTVSYRYQLPR